MVDEPRTLVLVDLDNIAGDVRTLSDLLPCAPPGRGDWLVAADVDVPTQESPDPRCVVAVALNTDTLVNGTDDLFDHLRRFARHTAHFVGGADTVGLELGITPSSPQAVDALLERLLIETPFAAHTGPFNEVWLLSGDLGLRTSIERILIDAGAVHPTLRPSPPRGRHTRHAQWVCRSASLRRRFPTPPRPPRCAPAEVAATAQNLLIDRPELVAWASRQSIELPHGRSAVEIGAECRRRPALLTQVAATTTALRGITRLAAFIRSGNAEVGTCAAIDGLELRTHQAAAGDYAAFGPSKLGPGALRLRDTAATVTTRIPLVVAATSRAVAVDAHGAVKVNATLATARFDVPLGDDDALVDFDAVTTEDALRLRVKSRPGVPPSVWWIHGMSPVSDPRFAGLGPILGGRTLRDIACRCAVAGTIADPRVVFRAPTLDGPVLIEQAIEANQLGLGVAGARQLAVLAPQTGLMPGTAPCAPIQDVSPREFQARYPELRAHFDTLRGLPLMIPRGPP